MSTCRIILLLEESVCYDQCVLLAKLLLAFALLHFVLQSQLTCYFKHLLISYFCIPVPNMKGTSFLVLILVGLVGLLRTM